MMAFLLKLELLVGLGFLAAVTLVRMKKGRPWGLHLLRRDMAVMITVTESKGRIQCVLHTRVLCGNMLAND